MATDPKPLVGVVMGSRSDWETMKYTAEVLTRFGVPHECRVLSAHRSPKLTSAYALAAEKRGLEVIIAAAGGAAHLAGVMAAHTIVPVLGVPIESASLKGLDSLLSTVQMPGGVPVGTLGIGKPAPRMQLSSPSPSSPRVTPPSRQSSGSSVADQEAAVRMSTLP